MADVSAEMSDGGDTSSKCRENRRRIKMRKLTAVTGETAPVPADTVGSGEKREADGSGSDLPTDEKRALTESELEPEPDPPSSSSSSSSSGGGGGGGAGPPPSGSGSGSNPVMDPDLTFGFVELAGLLRDMEDSVSLRPAFFTPVGKLPLHFFAVFDGHGGSHVSALCKERMHVLLAEEFGKLPETAEIGDEAVRAAVSRCFRRMDELALKSCACGRVGSFPCGCGRSETESVFVGSTAVVAVVGPGRILVANCGDSRAVLSRGGLAVPLSYDHKPDRPDERARVEAAGGRVVYNNGARVSGILAMSRALGDKYLKPIVTCEPEIKVQERHPRDECLILATDGLWDVLSNVMACNVARQCLEEEDPPSSSEAPGALEYTSSKEKEENRTRCRLAASLLGRLALGRDSGDNISVIVVDLRSG